MDQDFPLALIRCRKGGECLTMVVNFALGFGHVGGKYGLAIYLKAQLGTVCNPGTNPAPLSLVPTAYMKNDLCYSTNRTNGMSSISTTFLLPTYICFTLSSILICSLPKHQIFFFRQLIALCFLSHSLAHSLSTNFSSSDIFALRFLLDIFALRFLS